jgi:hypothetical protein
MTDEDSAYYARRAEAELDQAQRATMPEVVRVHYQLAEAYLERLEANDRVCSEQPT